MINKKNNFIVIEGLDGSGKGTISKKLSEKLGFELYKTPPYPYEQIRETIDATADIETRFFFYLSSVLYASKEITQILRKKHVICDRYIYSTVCYHSVLTPNFACFDISHLNILKPDFVFYLNASFEERAKRIAKRENRKIEDVMNDKYGKRNFLSKVEKEISKFKELIKIDTENRTIDEIVTQINEIIGDCK